MGNYEDNNCPEYYDEEEHDPCRVECEHCGRVFNKYDPEDADICPKCESKVRYCEECDKLVFLDGPHYTSLHGEVFCGLECWDRHLKELNGGSKCR